MRTQFKYDDAAVAALETKAQCLNEAVGALRQMAYRVEHIAHVSCCPLCATHSFDGHTETCPLVRARAFLRGRTI